MTNVVHNVWCFRFGVTMQELGRQVEGQLRDGERDREREREEK